MGLEETGRGREVHRECPRQARPLSVRRDGVAAWGCLAHLAREMQGRYSGDMGAWPIPLGAWEGGSLAWPISVGGCPGKVAMAPL